jgi:membrane protease YdiL (CAAX protease family)
LPFDQPLWASLGTIFGVALPAFLVMAAMHGWAGVRDLAQWYLLALLGVPIGALVCVSAIFGLAPLHQLQDKWPLLFTVVVPEFLLLIVFYIGPEEIGWMGFLQARLQERYGPLLASILVTIPFALYHLPGLMVQNGVALSLVQLPLVLLLLGVLALSQLFGRVVIMWLYNSTTRSVLLVGLFHSSFDATNDAVRLTLLPGADVGTIFLIPSSVLVVAAVLIVVFTRGRLSYKPILASPSEEAPHPQMRL